MLVFDQLKKNDPPLRVLSLAVLAGLLILGVGLWWVQVVSSRHYQSRLETQSFRTVRVPAVRGKILDRQGVALAESQPGFTLGLYLGDLSPQFQAEYKRLRPMRVVTNAPPFWKRWLGASAITTQRVRLNPEAVAALEWEARSRVVSNAVLELGRQLQQPAAFDRTAFVNHYRNRRALPYPVMDKLDPAQVARFEEQSLGTLGANLEIQSLRVYPFRTTAAHVLGYLLQDNSSAHGEEADFDYRLPDYRGEIGIEAGYDADLRGRAGGKSMLVNYLGYKQGESFWSPVEPGRNVVLTLDLKIQQAAERALLRVGAHVRGAVVVMDVTNGDILAMASAPAFDPAAFVPRVNYAVWTNLNNERTRPLINRATQENYAPGSIFKPVVALACLESGLNPKEAYRVQPDPANSARGCIFVGRRKIEDTASPGDYDFRRALLRSSNSYFVTNGIRYGIANIVKLAQRFHFGERMKLPTRQETAGHLPSLRRVTSSAWRDGDTANICIGQGEIDVTPLHMAVMTCAIANGGRVFWPRLVARIEPADGELTDAPVRFPPTRVRDELGVRPGNLRILHEAMLADTEDEEGTAYKAFRSYYQTPERMRVCGKTGTAQVTDTKNRLTGHNLWFISFAPYEQPRYAVVVMIEGAGSGGGTCAPVASEIYAAIQQHGEGKPGLLANTD